MKENGCLEILEEEGRRLVQMSSNKANGKDNETRVCLPSVLSDLGIHVYEYRFGPIRLDFKLWASL